MTPSPSAGLTVELVNQLRQWADPALIDVRASDHDFGRQPANSWALITALCDAWLATHKPANVCPSCGGDMNAAPLPGCNRMGLGEDEV